MILLSEANLNNEQEHSSKCNKPCLAALKCGEPGSALLNDGTPAGTTVTAAAITIDTSKFCNTFTKLEFTSNIIGVAFAGALNFQVFKSCNNQRPTPIGGQFNFAVTVPSIFADTFKFFVCDCEPCLNECCTYTVVVKAATSIIGNVGVFAARLTAITVDNPEQCC